MELSLACPVCHTNVRETDYFCFNCGANLKPSPPKTDIASQVILYTKSIFLPPFGVLWAIKYLKDPTKKSKMIGATAIILTMISFLITIKLFTDFMNQVNEQVSEQVNGIYGF